MFKKARIALLATVVACIGVTAVSQQQSPGTITLPQPPEILRGEEKVIAREGAGYLAEIAGVYILHLKGTPHEMGYQHGRLLAKMPGESAFKTYLQTNLYNRGYSHEYVGAQSRRMEQHIPAEYIEEMKGVVEGAKAAGLDATYDDILVGVTSSEILHHEPNKPPSGCSNFAVFGRYTVGGKLYHGRNLDWTIKHKAQDQAVVIVFDPAPGHGYPFALLGFGGAVGSVTGMNSQGISFGEMTSSSTDETFDGMPLMVLMRKVLQYSKNLDEAVAILQKGPRTTGWNFVIGDGKVPDARAVEVTARKCEVYRPADPREDNMPFSWSMPDAVRRTNHPITPEFLELLAKGYGVDLEAAKLILPTIDTWQRYKLLGDLFEQHKGKINEKLALTFLRTGPVAAGNTLHSVVFAPGDLKMWVANAGTDGQTPAHQRPYVELDLKKLLAGNPQ